MILEEYLFLHLQHIFTISILLTFSIVFGNYASADTATIPVSYRVILLSISVVSIFIIVGTTISHFINMRDREVDKGTRPNNLKELFHGNHIEDNLKIGQHFISIIFILVVIVILGVYLNQGNMTNEQNIALTVVSVLILLFTIYVYVISVRNSYLRTRSDTFNKTADELNKQLTK